MNKVITLGRGENAANFLTNKATLLFKTESVPSMQKESFLYAALNTTEPG
jgi:hypothetical protein